ncbi:methanogenesis marker 16 metalloprotein [Methanonatronarchaeum sp. AMET-Sl]|uniref:methanogenesis marker 16 metalloprotein n=1 Tax=Methanonatronarchaeum sp. AMET-Sl TaxID=3037654 RepID=UPI00244E0BB3|nr:methanogenesis marker 16 metalloprotein [Methanonatronarchaeum sp. AMET-Sl]WGI18072.1 methanogenesis marker 16 metalloprotein [Methanonatronarchaeum sp. AMET-Sl]
MKDINEINKKIEEKEATVYSAREFKQKIKKNEITDPSEVDVVTTATLGLMSGTTALLSIPISQEGVFRKAKKTWLNGVPATPGPCPNENLGLVETIVNGTAQSLENPEYGGGHLLRDIAEGKEIEVEVESIEGDRYRNTVTKKDLDFAQIITSRIAFKNYMAFLNKQNDTVKSIFSVDGLKGPYKEISVSGCGEINPLENDPELKTINVGKKVLLNGATGYIMGEGTRSTPQKPNLQLFGDLKEMNPTYMGGFKTSGGPECIQGVAVPIPVLNEEIFNNLKITDQQTKLPIGEIHDRKPFTHDNYASVWKKTDLTVIYNPDICKCSQCIVEEKCPTNAFTPKDGIDRTKCFNCGYCIGKCKENAFQGNLGTINVENKEVPIKLRQSNRNKAEKMAIELKKRIQKNEFKL